MRSSGGGSPATIAAVAVAAVLALLTVLVSTTLLVINRRILPRAVEAAQSTVLTRTGATLTVTESRYRLFRGITIDEVILADGDRRLAIDSVHVPLSRPTVRRLLQARRPAAEPTGSSDSSRDTHEAASSSTMLWQEIRDVASLLPDTIAVDGIRATGSHPETGPLSISAATGEVRHSEEEARIAVALGTEDPETGLAFQAIIRYGEEIAEASVTIGGLAVAGGPLIAAAGSTPASLDVKLNGTASSTPSYMVDGVVNLQGATVSAPVLAAEPVGPLDLRLTFDAEISDAAEVRSGTMVVNDLPFGITLSVPPTTDGSVAGELTDRLMGVAGSDTVIDTVERVQATIALDQTPVDAIARAVPTAFTDALTGIELDGRIDWRLNLAVPPAAIGDLEWTGATSVTDFSVTKIPEAVNPFILNDEFIYRIEYEGVDHVLLIPQAIEAPLELMLAHTEHSRRQILRWRAEPSSEAPAVIESPDTRIWPADHPNAPRPSSDYQFVRLADMSPWVIRAVLTTEDGDFFFHDGINFLTLIDALERNLQEGEVVLGASTLTMQLAKMLFLDAERTISRKLQEAFLVYLIESVVPVPKERILELYLNIAEFGPGLFGIAAGADHYFDKKPTDLTAGEATWLASILPSPVRYHSYYESGGISPGWFIRMQSYFDIMLERGRMTEEEYDEANQAPPAFAY